MTLAPIWPEQLERESKQFQGFPMRQIAAEEAQLRAQFALAGYHTLPGTEKPPHVSFGTWRARLVTELSADIMNVHSVLPCYRAVYADFAQWIRTRPDMLKYAHAESIDHLLTQQCHIDYHMTMWRKYGRRVLVFDERTFHLLAATPLPRMEARHLTCRFPNFWLSFPDSSGLTITCKEDPAPQMAAGCMVSCYPSGPTDQPREISIMVAGRSEKGFGDVDLNYVTMGLGPDADLSQIYIDLLNAGWSDRYADSPEVLRLSAYTWQTLPRIILGAILYLASEHPHIEPVNPPRRQKFAEIRSPQARQKNLDRQEAELSKVSRLGYLRLGRREGERSQALREAAEQAAGRKLTYKHFVPGFWRRQHHGKGNQLVKLIFVEGFWRGPEFSESLGIHASRVQKAQPVVQEDA